MCDVDTDALQFLQELLLDQELLVDELLGTDVAMLHQQDHCDVELDWNLFSPSPTLPSESQLNQIGLSAAPALAIAPRNSLPLSDDEMTSTAKATITATSKRKRPNRSPNYDTNRARNLRRHELSDLRRQIAEMEQELARRHDRAVSQAATAITSAGPRAVTAHPKPVSTGATLWQRIANRQQNERERAERENRRLKNVLATQLQVAQSLERILHKRTATQGCEEFQRHLLHPHMCARRHLSSDAAIFQRLLNQVHACYRQADQYFEKVAMNTIEAPFRDARQQDTSTGTDSTTIEVFVNDVLPFPVQTVGRAAWGYFSHEKNRLPYRLYYERVSESTGPSENTIVETSGVEFHVNNSNAVFHATQAIRQYVESDRVVIAYATTLEPVEFAGKAVHGCELVAWGCMVLKKSTTLDADSHSVLQSCFFLAPQSDSTGDAATEANRYNCSLAGELTEFMLRSTANIMGGWLQMIENILVMEQGAGRG